MKSILKQEIAQSLLGASSYREFLASAFASLKKHERNFSFASFCRKAGLAARSYPQDVLQGRRPLTARSLPLFARGLGLNADLNKYFTLLVASENHEVDPYRRTAAEIKKARESLRVRIENRGVRVEKDSPRGEIYRFQNWPKIFAALGDPLLGASLEEISKRCALPRTDCEAALTPMVQAGIVRTEADRYLGVGSHIVYPNLVGTGHFKDFFVSSLNEVRASANRNFNAPEKLFLNSSFTVRKDKLPQFRQDLKEMLLRYIDDAEDPCGECMSSLVVGFFPNPSHT